MIKLDEMVADIIESVAGEVLNDAYDRRDIMEQFKNNTDLQDTIIELLKVCIKEGIKKGWTASGFSLEELNTSSLLDDVDMAREVYGV